MKTPPRIFKRVNLLHIRFEPDGGAVFSPSEPKATSKHPLVAVVSGHGVITKDVAAGGIVETVMGDPETFLWTILGERVSFVRREQLAATMQELEKRGIRPLYTECLPDTDEATLKGVEERFHAEHSGWRRILKPSPEGSRLSLLVAKRLQLPVLGALMLVLVANFALSSRVRENFQAANSELTALKRTSSALTESNENRRALLEGFSCEMPFRHSRLSDRIGGAVPDKIALTEIAIAPLVKSIEAGKPLQQNTEMVVIRGETTSSEAVSEFTEALGRLRLGTIRLAAVEQQQQRETERAILTFRIEITL
jgi:hypothetical protein